MILNNWMGDCVISLNICFAIFCEKVLIIIYHVLYYIILCYIIYLITTSISELTD